jgi:hypothetical protein
MPQLPSLAGALGVPLFTTDLYVPHYRDGDVGRWRIVHGGFALDRGYHSGVWAVQGMPALLRRTSPTAAWETWMSLSPHEVESQEFGCRHAWGRTVVMGLGMGWIALNLAQHPAVSHVTVIERDPEVIDLFHRSGAIDGLPESILAKLEIVEADALVWRPAQPVDFLYADIWLKIAEPSTLDDVRRMQANIQARQIYFWGQELVLYAQAQPLLAAGGQLTPPVLQRCIAEKIALPLLVPEGLDYAGYIERVVANRRARGLPA